MYTRTEKEVVAKLQALQGQVAGGMPAVNQRTTIDAYLAGWLEMVEPRLRPATLARYRRNCGVPTGPRGTRPHKAGPTDDRRRGSRPCAVTRFRPQSADGVSLSGGPTHGPQRRREARPSGPQRGQELDAPKIPYQPPRILSPDAAWGVLAAIKDDQLRRLATVAVHTGLERGELGPPLAGCWLAGQRVSTSPKPCSGPTAHIGWSRSSRARLGGPCR